MKRTTDPPRRPSADAPPAPRVEAAACARHLRLKLDPHAWRGPLGNWGGRGTGSSVDFQDHRPYVPGDDPRHIDWAAYARSGQTIMKLYREEVSPRVDLLIDTSPSMSLTPAKRHLTQTLLHFCVESALGLGASLRLHLLDGPRVETIDPARTRAPDWTLPAASPGGSHAPDPSRVPLRGGSLRIYLSDLLYTLPPPDLLAPLRAHDGSLMLFCPADPREARPDWRHNMELIDCEQRTTRRQRVDPALLRRYREAYARHLQAWCDAATRYGVRLARLSSETPLAAALGAEPLHAGLVETWD